MSTTAECDYLLGTNDEELRRLQAQHNTWQAETTDLWDRAAFRAGQTILDLGCGPGFTSLELGERVGAGVVPIGGIARPGNRIWCWIEDFLHMYLPELVARGALGRMGNKCPRSTGQYFIAANGWRNWRQGLSRDNPSELL